MSIVKLDDDTDSGDDPGSPEPEASSDHLRPLATFKAPPRSWSRSVPERLGIVLTVTGVVLLLFVGYLFGWTGLEAAHSQHRLLTTFTGQSCAVYTQSCAAEFAGFNGVAAPNGQAAAVLQVPSLHLRQIVVEGTTASDLEQGPGLMPATAVPGAGGEAVIAGRRSTFGGPFSDLGSLRPGDVVEVADFLGTFQFQVERVLVVPAGHALPVVRSNLGSLALVTSADTVPPEGLEVVEARLVGNPVQKPHATLPRAALRSELALTGDSSAWWGLLGWGMLLVLLLTATAVAYRRSGRALLVYVLSTPILLPVLLYTFQNASRLLPATM